MPCARTSSSRRSACTSSSSACSLTTSGLGPAACMRCGGAVAAGPGAWASACAGGAPSPVRSITSSAGCVAGWGAGRARLRRGACCCAGQACPPAQQADSSVDSSHLLPGTVSMPHEAAACQRCPAEQSAPRCQSDHDRTARLPAELGSVAGRLWGGRGARTACPATGCCMLAGAGMRAARPQPSARRTVTCVRLSRTCVSGRIRHAAHQPGGWPPCARMPCAPPPQCTPAPQGVCEAHALDLSMRCCIPGATPCGPCSDQCAEARPCRRGLLRW